MFCLQPAGVNHVRIRWGLSVFDKDMPAEDIQSRIELWQAINAEHKAKLAKIQHSLNSKSAISGPLAPDDFEGTIRDFYEYLAGQYASHSKTSRSPEPALSETG